MTLTERMELVVAQIKPGALKTYESEKCLYEAVLAILKKLEIQ